MESATITVAEGNVAAVEATLDDVQRMLKIETATVVAGEVQNGLASVETVLAPVPAAE